MAVMVKETCRNCRLNRIMAVMTRCQPFFNVKALRELCCLGMELGHSAVSTRRAAAPWRCQRLVSSALGQTTEPRGPPNDNTDTALGMAGRDTPAHTHTHRHTSTTGQTHIQTESQSLLSSELVPQKLNTL
ncbi:hypothetical protein RRG08_060465 [Elysia crispata]|uniref:Uncharacterized protein n=1 Tax=Elysia crispata TaxID=231223 RepID=A0AAE1B1E3_9GAST|nr:hypothetical protein RRG08_060465 [Elysia crispata]